MSFLSLLKYIAIQHTHKTRTQLTYAHTHTLLKADHQYEVFQIHLLTNHAASNLEQVI